MAIVRSELVPFILSVTNTLAYYGFGKLRIHSFFVVQALGLYYKTFYSRNLRMIKIFVLSRPFQPNLIFASKARAYPRGAPERGSPIGWTQEHTYKY